MPISACRQCRMSYYLNDDHLCARCVETNLAEMCNRSQTKQMIAEEMASDLHKRLAEAVAGKAEIKDKLDEKIKALQWTQNELDVMRNQEFKERTERRELEDEVTALRKKLEDYTKTCEELRLRSDAAEHDLYATRKEVAALKNIVEREQGMRNATEADRDRAERQLTVAGEARTEAEEKVRNLEALVNKLAGESNKDIVTERESLREQLTQAITAKTEAEKESNQLREKHANTYKAWKKAEEEKKVFETECERLVKLWGSEHKQMQEHNALKYAEALADREHKARLEVESERDDLKKRLDTVVLSADQQLEHYMTVEAERDDLKKQLSETEAQTEEKLAQLRKNWMAAEKDANEVFDAAQKGLAIAHSKEMEDLKAAHREQFNEMLSEFNVERKARPAAEKRAAEFNAALSQRMREGADLVAERDELKRQLDKCERLVEGWHTERDRELAARKYAEAHADREHRARLEVEAKLAQAVTAPVYVTDPLLVAERDKVTLERDSLQQRLATVARLKDAAEYERDELKRQLAEAAAAVEHRVAASPETKPEIKSPTKEGTVYPKDKTIKLMIQTTEGLLETRFNVEEEVLCDEGIFYSMLTPFPRIRFIPSKKR